MLGAPHLAGPVPIEVFSTVAPDAEMLVGMEDAARRRLDTRCSEQTGRKAETQSHGAKAFATPAGPPA
jgi:hypothetical protein